MKKIIEASVENCVRGLLHVRPILILTIGGNYSKVPTTGHYVDPYLT